MPRPTMILVAFFVAAPIHADEKLLNGTWLAKEARHNGEKVSEDFVKAAKLICTDGKYEAALGDVVENGSYKVDRAKKPHSLVLKPTDGAKKGKSLPGIFELEGDVLKICFDPVTDKLPKDFNATASNTYFVVTYHRKK